MIDDSYNNSCFFFFLDDYVKSNTLQVSLNTVINYSLHHHQLTLILVVHSHIKVGANDCNCLSFHFVDVLLLLLLFFFIFFQNGLFTEIGTANHFLCTASINSFKFIKHICRELNFPQGIEEFTTHWRSRQVLYSVTYLNTGNLSTLMQKNVFTQKLDFFQIDTP